MAQAAIGLLSAVFTSATGGTLMGGFLLGSGAAGTIFTHFLVSTAMGLAIDALTPKPNLSASGGYSLAGTSGSALDHQIIYGQTRVGGVRIYDSSTGGNNEYLHRVIGFAGHEITEYSEIYLNDEVVVFDPLTGNVTSPARYDGYVRIKPYLGTISQAADTDLISETADLTDGVWTPDHKLQNIAYLYVRFKYNADVFPNGIPSVSAVIKGKKVYDPSTTTTAWSDNPALCIRDYLTSEYGLAQPSSRIDDTLITTAANICDQTTEGEKRYTCNGAFVTSAEPAKILSDLLTSMGGLLWYGQGKWRIKASSWSEPTVSFDESDLRSGLSLSTRHSRRDNFNSVKGTFRGAESEWQVADYKEVTDPAFVSADNNLVNVLDFPLPFTSSSLTAQRVARIALNRNREQLTFSASFGLRAFQVQVGDFINLTNERFGWVDKPFEVTEWTFGLTDDLDIQVRMTLREISQEVFTAVDGSIFESNNTTLPNPYSGLEIYNLSASGGGRTQGDGTFINSAILSWDAASSAFTSYYEVQWKPVADSNYTSTTTTEPSIEISPLIDGVEYVFRVRAVSTLGNTGPYSSTLFIGGGDTTAPGVPTDFSANGTLGFINLSWVSPADIDFNYTEIWESSTSSLASAVEIAQAFGNFFARGNLAPLTTRYYWIRSVDFSGNKSAFVGPVSGTSAQIEVGDIGPAVIQYDNFTSDVTALFDGIVSDISTLTADVSDRVLISDYNITVELQQQLEDATTQLATDALALALNASSLESRINDAGITVDPTTGVVTIQGLSSVEERVNNVEINLDAVEGELSLKATTTYVNDAIAAATLPEATLAALDDLELRVDTVEIDLNAVEGSITLSSTGSLYNVNDGVLGVEALEGRITVNEGEIALKASQTELDNVESRLSNAEIELSGIDVPTINLTVSDVRRLSGEIEDLSQLTLEQTLGRYNDRKYVTQDVALARQSLTADVNDQREAVATLETEVKALIDENSASILTEQQARVSSDEALASDITQLQSTVVDLDSGIAGNATAISSLDTRVTNAEGTLTSQSSAITSLESSLASANNSISTNATAISGLDTRVSINETEITSQASQINSLSSTLTSAQGDIAGNATAISGLDTRVTSAEGTISSQSSAITSLQSGLTSANNSISGNATAISNLDTRVTSAEGTISSQSSAITSLQSGLTSANNNISGNATAINSLDTRVTNAEGTISSQSSAITSLQSGLNSANNSISTNATAISGLDTRVTSAEGTISSQSSAITSLSTTVGDNTTSITQALTSIDGIEGKYGVTIDSNGNATGFQLLSGTGGSAFNVRADQFAVFNSSGAGGDNPFTIFTSSRTVDGVVYPAGTYIKDAYIDTAAIVDGSIDNAKIGTASVDTLEIAGNAVTGKVRLFDSTIRIVSSVTDPTTLCIIAIDRLEGFSTDFSFSANFDGFGDGLPTLLLERSTDLGVTWTNIRTLVAGVTPLGIQSLASFSTVDFNTAGGDTRYRVRAKKTDPSLSGGYDASVRFFNVYFSATQFKR